RAERLLNQFTERDPMLRCVDPRGSEQLGWQLHRCDPLATCRRESPPGQHGRLSYDISSLSSRTVLWPRLALVLSAQPDAPEFLRAHRGRCVTFAGREWQRP